jgi:3-deoxy-D-manno-octulosonate 8-phosphate phosphatase (KDO 8-P phosphatase)
VTFSIPDCSSLSLLVFDFDGVMTDNRVFIFEDGREAVACNRADGLGVDMLRAAGYDMIILSTETNSVVAQRAKKMKLVCHQGIGDKGKTLQDIAKQAAVPLDAIAMVGNDVNDMPAMQIAGWRVAPADAHPSILAIADHVTAAKGGEGVIRELADLLCEQI